MAFANAPMLVGGANYLAGGLSDHTPLSVHIGILSACRKGAWRLNPGWLEVEGVTSQVAPHFTGYWKDNEGSANPVTVWDAFKACMRGHYISAIKQVRRTYNKKEQELQERERTCELAHANDKSDTTYNDLLEAQGILALHFTDLTHTSRTKSAESIFEQGDKNGKLLAMLVADQRIQTNIPCSKICRGDILTNPVDIMDTFVEYYKALFTPNPVYNKQHLDALLSFLNIPVLSASDRDVLEADITEKEIEKAIRAFPPHKSPGPDGFCIEWYRLHIEDLVPRLKALFHYCLKHNCMPNSMLEAQVILLPKPGKDPLSCSSYRPIALLNRDLKILTKILATRLSQVITTLVDIDQTGFIPQKSTDTNLRRLFAHLQIDHDNAGTRTVVSLEMSKAFDSVEWNYMLAVLRHMGLGEVFMTWISLLYIAPQAAKKLGTSVSHQFSVGRGTRRGCPLSPYLFALVIEPLAIALRRSSEVRALEVGGIREFMALYADDMLCFYRMQDHP